MQKNNNIKILTLILGCCMCLWVQAANLPVNRDANDVAIGGYDPVAYFTVGEATKGSTEYMAVHKGAIYQFASAANRDLFKANPKTYAPQFGGYCSLSLTLEQNVSPDPNAFSVIEDKLYLTVSQEANKKWLQDVEGNIAKAEAYFGEDE